MAPTLSSNVVNYLIWRYLQEAGYGNAALHLSRSWMRDPESLPFSASVAPHTLIHLLQDGMLLDQLQAEATNTDIHYNFGADHGHPYPHRIELLTLDKGTPAHVLASQANGAVQDPPPKKSSKKGAKSKKTNGVEPRTEPETPVPDPMDIDTNGTTQHAPASAASVRAESEMAPSEAESPSVTSIPISTLSIGQHAHIQTVDVLDLAPHTTFVPLPKQPDAILEHTSWDPKGSPVLLAAGRSLLQMHVINSETTTDSVSSIPTASLTLPVNNFDITALCWHSDGELTVSAREESRNERGEKMMMNKLIKLVDGGSNSHVISSTAGLVNTLRWNPEKELLLSISTDGEKGSIKVWKNDSDSIPAWADFTETAILDAFWISESSFVVCGIKLFKIYDVGDSLTTQRTLDTEVMWEMVKYDPSSGILAALGSDSGTHYLGILHPNDSINLQVHEYPDEFPMDLDFRIRTSTNTLTNGTSVPSVLLATGGCSGVTRIWDANEPFKRVRRMTATEKAEAHKVAFSPDGVLLAVGGPYAVMIWDMEKQDEPIASWYARDFPTEKWNPSQTGEYSLGWDSDSSKLSIAHGNQIAIINIPR